ncbi:MAG: metal-dependent transcriptional regulator [Endomicrobiales bacterium]
MNAQECYDVEEALGVIWNCIEKKQLSDGKSQKNQLRESIVERLKSGVSETVFDELVDKKLIMVDGNSISLMPQGEAVGRDVTRRHRLTERLLADVLLVKGADIDATACKIEHIISTGVADSICTLLGHPRVCPHGSPIPSGECCKRLQSSAEPIVTRLDTLPVGESAIVAYLVTSSHPYIHKLLSLGVVPGTPVRLHQKSPSFVITVNETQIALDAEIARQIYVRTC